MLRRTRYAARAALHAPDVVLGTIPERNRARRHGTVGLDPYNPAHIANFTRELRTDTRAGVVCALENAMPGRAFLEAVLPAHDASQRRGTALLAAAAAVVETRAFQAIRRDGGLAYGATLEVAHHSMLFRGWGYYVMRWITGPYGAKDVLDPLSLRHRCAGALHACRLPSPPCVRACVRAAVWRSCAPP